MIKIESLYLSYFNKKPQISTFAPGRVEFIGNHTDYNGGNVMGASISEGIWASGSLREDEKIILKSFDFDNEIVTSINNIDVLEEETKTWANYPLGVFNMLVDEGIKTSCGFELYFYSNLPIGAGLSSSAALELSTSYLLSDLFDTYFSKSEMARIARRAENEFVGIPTGILDQGTSAFGKKNHLVSIDCAKEEYNTIPLIGNSKIWIFNTHTKHSLVDSLYEKRHSECMNALKKLSEVYNVSYLCQLTSKQVEEQKQLLTNDEFKRAFHVTSENERVIEVNDILVSTRLTNIEKMVKLGTCLENSHLSSKNYFNNSTDELDFLSKKLNQHNEVWGARLTGGGFGGAVMALTTEKFSEKDSKIVSQQYGTAFNAECNFFVTEVSDGARVIV